MAQRPDRAGDGAEAIWRFQLSGSASLKRWYRPGSSSCRAFRIRKLTPGEAGAGAAPVRIST